LPFDEIELIFIEPIFGLNEFLELSFKIDSIIIEFGLKISILALIGKILGLEDTVLGHKISNLLIVLPILFAKDLGLLFHFLPQLFRQDIILLNIIFEDINLIVENVILVL
jgi:hypothetical protein